MKKIEVSAKSIEKAIEEGLATLGTTLENVDITVITEGGLFKKAKIEMSLIEEEPKKETKKEDLKKQEGIVKKEEQPKKESKSKESKINKDSKKEVGKKESFIKEKESPKIDKKEKNSIKEDSSEQIVVPKNRKERKEESLSPEEKEKLLEEVEKVAYNFIHGITEVYNINANVSVERKDGDTFVSVDGENLGVLIGYRGVSLEAIQFLMNTCISNRTHYRKKVFLNIENYREKREETLKDMADRIAQKVVSSQRRCKLEPMNSFERRIIHTFLQSYTNISTRSEGAEPNRYLVIEYISE